MQSNPHKLTVIDGETLMDKRLPPTKFCVDTLLPQGLCILGGSPKVGKSWLVLDLCVHVAQGTPLWGLDVARGDVLYLCLEDSERRRINLKRSTSVISTAMTIPHNILFWNSLMTGSTRFISTRSKSQHITVTRAESTER